MEYFTIDELVKFSAKLSVEEMEHLCDMAGIGLFNLDVRNGDIKLNRNLTMLAGYEPGDLPHSENTKIMLTFEDDRPRVAECLQAVLSGKQNSYQLEYRMRRRDGSIVSVYECVYAAERDKEGNVLRLAGIAQDLSKVKWAEDKARLMEHENRRLIKGAAQGELEEQNRMLRAVNSAAAMIIGGFHQDYELVLQQSLQILGESIQAERAYIWRNQESDGKLYCFHRSEWARSTASAFAGTTQLFAYDDFLPDWQELAGCGQDKDVLSARLTAGIRDLMEAKVKGSEDTPAKVSLPLFLHGEFWGFVGFDDYTCDRNFTDDEKEIMGSGALVIASSISRNETYGKLNEARKSAMESTRAKGEFLSRMSHEIRTPMNAIIGMTTIAKRTDDPAKVQYCLDKVDASSRQLLGLINDILDMSKIEADKLEITYAPFDFEKMIQYVLNMMQVKLEEKHQDLYLDIDKVVTRSLISDELRLSQVLINLLSNAIKFTPESGSITLKIREFKKTDDRQALRIEVADTGIGIDPEKRDKLFESFVQANGGITRQYGGTGLGLAISKKIVDLLGGDIWVASALGEGARFIFEIDVQWGEMLPGPEFITTLPESMRVLVVDDKDDVLEYFENIFKSFSINCDTADCGEKAVALVKKSIAENQPYDIVFLDWNMPGMNGGTTAKEIRKLAGDELISVMISVAEWSDIEKEVREYGVTNFLSKPVLPSVLYDKMLELTHKNLVIPKTDPTSDEIDWSGKRILVAEDVDINREIIAGVLEGTGLELIFAEDGEAAVACFLKDRESIDLILMDIQMPRMDGLEATRIIRASNTIEGKNIPILAMTANAFKEDEEMCLEAGMNAHLAKPINVDDIYRVLQQHLD